MTELFMQHSSALTTVFYACGFLFVCFLILEPFKGE